MEHIGKEIANYLRANKITQEEVAGAFGVSQAYISALLSGKKAFGKKTAELWHNHFGFNRTFLLTGEGDLMDVQVTRMDHQSAKGDGWVKLESYNQHHGPMDVRLENIKAIALVKFSVRINTMV